MNEQVKESHGILLPENHNKPSTRRYVVDMRFARLLAQDFSIPAATVLDALIDEPQKQAISICEWASRTDDPAHALRCWARQHGRGAYGTPAVARGGGRSNTRQHGWASGPASERGIAPRRSCVLDPARVRANVSRMAD